MANTVGPIVSTVGGDENAKQSKWNTWFKQYGKYFKYVLLAIAFILFYQVLSNTDQTYTSLVTDKSSMLKLFWVIVLVSIYIGGTPAALKTVAIIGVMLFLVPVFFQTTPQQITSKITEITSFTVPPRDLGWMSREIKPIPEKIVRVYNGDRFVYKAPSGFWVVEEGGTKHFHNPSLQPGEVRSFNFYNLPTEGREIKIQTGEKNTPFWMDFRIVKEKH